MTQITTRFRISRTMFGSHPVTSIFMSPAAAVWVKRTVPAERHRIVRVGNGYLISANPGIQGPVLRPTTTDKGAPWRLLQSTPDSKLEAEWPGSRCFNVTGSGIPTYDSDNHGIFVPFNFETAAVYEPLRRGSRKKAETTMPQTEPDAAPVEPDPAPRPTEVVHHDASVAALMGHVEAINRIKAEMDNELDLRVVDGYVEAWILTRIGGKR